jgi:hypothetical protein
MVGGIEMSVVERDLIACGSWKIGLYEEFNVFLQLSGGRAGHKVLLVQAQAILNVSKLTNHPAEFHVL